MTRRVPCAARRSPPPPRSPDTRPGLWGSVEGSLRFPARHTGRQAPRGRTAAASAARRLAQGAARAAAATAAPWGSPAPCVPWTLQPGLQPQACGGCGTPGTPRTRGRRDLYPPRTPAEGWRAGGSGGSSFLRHDLLARDQYLKSFLDSHSLGVPQGLLRCLRRSPRRHQGTSFAPLDTLIVRAVLVRASVAVRGARWRCALERREEYPTCPWRTMHPHRYRHHPHAPDP